MFLLKLILKVTLTPATVPVCAIATVLALVRTPVRVL